MKRSAYAVFLAAGVLSMPFAVSAADHQDGPAASADPAADITDIFAWMTPDKTKVNLVMGVVPAATSTSKFSNAVQYVFHTSSSAKFGATATSNVNIVCTFDTSQKISCWAGDEYLTGDASSTNGISSSSGKLKVFAGLRDDPFFFNLDGFKATATAVHNAAGALTFDAAGCPVLDAPTATTLVNQLKTAPGGGAPQDHFKGLNVLAIVMQVDTTLLNQGGPVLSVWGSTNKSP